jgi:hypothetical protein
MNTRTHIIFVAALASMMPALHAQGANTPSPASQLEAFVGDGTCTGNMMAMSKNPGHATTAKYRGEKTLDGRWVVIRYEEDQTAANPKPFKIVQYFGYDATKKRFVSVIVDNNSGVGYSTSFSRGWNGDAIIFDESATMDGKQASYRDTFTTGESGTVSHTGTMQDKNGKWVKTDEETCHKA